MSVLNMVSITLDILLIVLNPSLNIDEATLSVVLGAALAMIFKPQYTVFLF